MNALIVLAAPPLPEGGAPGKHARGLIRGLAEHGVAVTAVAADQYFTDELRDALPVERVTVPPPSAGLASYPRRLRRPRGDLGRGRFAERVRELASAADVVHLEQTETAWSDAGVARPSVVHVHNRVLRDESPGPPWQPRFRRVVEQALAERAAVRRHRYLLASSPAVAADLRALAPRSVVVDAPLCLDPGDYRLAPLDGAPLAGIIGTAAWAPTRRAMERLVGGIWPELRRRCPGARLVVAGRGTEELVSLATTGVEILGTVPSAVDFFAQLSVLVYPLDRGSGMKVKVLESLACGVPVVTTAAGAEGVDAGEGVVVAEDDAALVAAAAALLADETERRERGRAARRAFEERYSPGPATEPVAALYRQMAR